MTLSTISTPKRILACILILSSLSASADWEKLPKDERGLEREFDSDSIKWTSPILYATFRQKQADGSYRLSTLEVDADKSCPQKGDYYLHKSPYPVKEVFEDQTVEIHQVTFQQAAMESEQNVWEVAVPSLCMVALDLKAGKKL